MWSGQLPNDRHSIYGSVVTRVSHSPLCLFFISLTIGREWMAQWTCDFGGKLDAGPFPEHLNSTGYEAFEISCIRQLKITKINRHGAVSHLRRTPASFLRAQRAIVAMTFRCPCMYFVAIHSPVNVFVQCASSERVSNRNRSPSNRYLRPKGLARYRT